jgi:[ribosomal protein S5]-alanine N-acetyltransferase
VGENVGSFGVTIRDLNETKVDLDTYLGWLRDEDNNPFIESVRADYSFSELTDYLKSKLGSSSVRFWGIFTEFDEFIGTVKLDPIDFVQGKAWLGIMIGDVSQRGKGYGRMVLQQVAQYASENLKLKELILGVHKNNLPALRLYIKQGFQIIETNEVSFVMKKDL